MGSIELVGVTKRYADGTEAVTDLDLEVRDGELMILVGPSGSGKSTALRMIAGLESITEGELRIGDERVNELEPKARDIAMVFQNYALYPHMPVRKNMAFALQLAGMDKGEIERRVDEAAQLLDLSDHLDRRPANLSGGQRQRVAMGRAIVREPKAFLMDEPLSNLDAKLRVQMRANIAMLQHRLAVTTVYVTHDQVEAMTLGHRVAVMRRGRLQQVGSPQELYAAPTNVFVAGFLGSPATNFLLGRIDGDGVETVLGRLPLPARLREAVARHEGGEAIVGVRPEHFEDATLVDPARVGHRFEAEIELSEAMGAETLAYFSHPAEGDLRRLRELTDEAAGVAHVMGADRIRVVARLDRTSRVRTGERAGLWLDTSEMQLFDPVSGDNLEAGR